MLGPCGWPMKCCMPGTNGHQWKSQDFLALAEVKCSATKLELAPEVPPERFGIGHSRFYPKLVRPISAAALERSARFNITFGSYMHTATPVPVYAQGPGEQKFHGYLPNTTVGRWLVEWMSKPLQLARD